MKKKWHMLIGASLFTGVVGSFALHKKKKNDSDDEFIQKYFGEWRFSDPDQKNYHRLTIQPSFSVALDYRELKVSIIELTKKRLVLQDEYGYHLILQVNDDKSATLYDEADDYSHALSAV